MSINKIIKNWERKKREKRVPQVSQKIKTADGYKEIKSGSHQIGLLMDRDKREPREIKQIKNCMVIMYGRNRAYNSEPVSFYDDIHAVGDRMVKDFVTHEGLIKFSLVRLEDGQILREWTSKKLAEPQQVVDLRSQEEKRKITLARLMRKDW